MKERPLYTIEVLDVFFLYAVGLDFIAISTKPDGQWAKLPSYMQVCFAIETPHGIEIPTGKRAGEEIETLVSLAIRKKVSEQRRANSKAGRVWEPARP